MKIEILYSDDCPNWHLTKGELESVLQELDVTAPIDLVTVKSNAAAETLRFVGSPSVRINEEDVGPGTPTDGFNLECRLYWVDGRPMGTPPRDMITRAVARAAAQSRGSASSRHAYQRQDTSSAL